MDKIKFLEEKARQVRMLTLKMIYEVASGHTGSAFSMVEIITTILFNEMNWGKFLNDVKGKEQDEQLHYWHNPSLARDRFVLSKGHGVPSWYAALALAGFIEESELSTLRAINSRLQGHPLRKVFPFIDATTGSLGQGQSEALGYALAKKIAGKKEKVYCVMGDGENNEGQVWETALSAPKFKLDNLIIVIDFNRKQGEGDSAGIMPLGSLDDKWRAFNWHVQHVNGHNIKELLVAFQKAYKVKGRPHVIIADTEKGYLCKGKVFRDGSHSPAAICDDEYKETVCILRGEEGG